MSSRRVVGSNDSLGSNSDAAACVEASTGVPTYDASTVVGVGTGLFFGQFPNLVLSRVDDRELGSATGAVNALQQLGGAVAAAIFSTVIFDQIGRGASPFVASELAYWLCAALLMVTWVSSFALPNISATATGKGTD